MGLRRLSAICLLAALVLSACTERMEPIGRPNPNPAIERDITPGLGYGKVMILYSEGYNNLTKNLNDNINQLCEGEIPSARGKNAIVVYSHAAAGMADFSTPTEPVIYQIYKDHKGIVRDTLKRYPSDAATMEPEFVTDVLNSIRRMFPASGYGLVYSSHGTGWIPAGYKEESDIFSVAPSSIGAHFGGSSRNSLELDINELREAIPFRLEYIVFDVCLMGGVEVVYELRDVCDRIVASPTEVLTSGFNYPKMAQRLLCDGEPDLEGLCKDYFTELMKGRDATIGLYDCSKVQGLADVCRQVFAAHRDKVEEVQPGSVQSYNYSFSFHYDLRDYIRALGATEQELEEVDKALDALVVFKAASPTFLGIAINPDRFSGISTYIPVRTRPQLNASYRETSWNRATGLLD